MGSVGEMKVFIDKFIKGVSVYIWEWRIMKIRIISN